MIVEVGKTYRNGSGDTVTIGGYANGHEDTKDVVWSIQGDWYYTNDGAFYCVYLKGSGRKAVEATKRLYGWRQLVEEVEDDA